jgi:predicted alpha/beta superfamily hydrolase
MIKAILTFLFITTAVYSQKTTETFDSFKLDQQREITIGLPASYEKNPDKKYPVLYLLDGDYLFDPFYGALSYGEYWEDIPETIVVGISQNKKNERETDCTFSDDEGTPSLNGAKFFEFMGNELLPYIEKKYRTLPFRIIAGHDTTAGFLNFFLYKENPIFNAYISLSPDLAPKMELRLPARLASLKQPVFYYLSTAEGELEPESNPINALIGGIKNIKNESLNFKVDEFKEATHYSLVLYSIPNALYQIFQSYKPISPKEYEEKIAVLKENQVEYIVKKYDFINKSLGLKMQVRLNDIKAIETAILKNKNYSELDKLSNIARKNYPKSMLADYYLAVMYENLEEFPKASKYYQNAFVLNEISDLTKDDMIAKYEELKTKAKPKK